MMNTESNWETFKQTMSKKSYTAVYLPDVIFKASGVLDKLEAE